MSETDEFTKKETVKDTKKATAKTPEELKLESVREKVKAAFEKRWVVITPRMKHDAKRATMQEPVPFDPDRLDLEMIDKLWNIHRGYHYPIEAPVAITKYAYNQLKKSYVGVKRDGDLKKEENATDSIKKVHRYIIQDVEAPKEEK